MNPIRRELLNGLFVLVVASLMSVAFEAFQISFNVQVWVLILMAIAIAVSGYVVFEFALKSIASAEDREQEWLKRVGTPARLELNREGGDNESGCVTVPVRFKKSPEKTVSDLSFQSSISPLRQRRSDLGAIMTGDKHLDLIAEELRPGMFPAER